MRTGELNYRYYGLFAGTVVSVDDPEQIGRVRIDTQQYADGDDGDEVWAMVARPAGGQSSSVFFTPQPGDQVILGYLAGDVDQPIVVGYAHSTAERPPEPVDTKRHGLVTSIGSLVFDEAQKKITVTFKGPPESTVTLDNTGVSIKSDLKIQLDAPQVSVNAATTISLGAPLLLFGGYPSFGFAFPPVAPANLDGPVQMDFKDKGLEITTGTTGKLCINGEGVALESFVTEKYNAHQHGNNGAAPPDKQWSRTTDPDGTEVTLCDGGTP